MNDLARVSLVVEARRFVGQPYRYDPRADGGMDCREVCVRAYNAVFPLEPIPITKYGSILPLRSILRELQRYCRPVATGMAGDVVVLEDCARFHLGIHAGETVIHASRDLGRVVEDPRDRLIIRSSWRFRGVR